MTRSLPSHPSSRLFEPMIYIAWADGGLEPEELDAISRQIAQHPELGAELKRDLVAWLDPSQPPTAAELASLLERIRTGARELTQPSRQSLLALGTQLAERAGHQVSEDEVRAVASLAEAIGVSGNERASSILSSLRRPEDKTAISSSQRARELAAALEDSNQALRADVFAFLGELESADETSRTAYRKQVHRWLGAIAERGWGMSAYPKAVGGEGDLGRFLAVFETLGYGDLSLLVKFGVQFGLYGLGIAMLGTPEQHQVWLANAGTLQTAGCFAMTESAHGSNVAELETTATYDQATDEFVINTPRPAARKDYIGNAANHAESAVVFAQLVVGENHHGVHALMVPLRDSDGRILPGRLIEECGGKFGLEGVDNGRISFSQVRVPRQSLLARFASVESNGSYHSDIASPTKRFFTMLGTLVGGRIAVASAAVSASKLSLTIAVRYALRRRQFGPRGEPEFRLIDYPHHQRRLLVPLARTFAMHAATRSIGQRFIDEGDGKELETDVAAIKAAATRHASETIGECREACGGRGYLSESRFAQLKADTDVFTTFEGDNSVLLQLVAKGLLSDYARGMAGLGALGLARFIGKRALAVFDRNPFVIRRTDSEHLRASKTQRELFAARCDDLLHSLARRVKGRLDKGMDSFTAFLECQSHAIELGRAHGDRLALDALCELESHSPCEELTTLRSLFALSTIEGEASWYLENGYIEAAKIAAIRDQAEGLGRELVPVAGDLVASFGLPDNVVRAPIGLAGTL